MNSRRAAAFALSALAWSAVASAQTPARRSANVTSGCVDRFDAAADYFPDKATVDDAVVFRVEYRKSYKVVTVTQSSAGGPAERYVLAQCGAPAPPLEGALAGAQLVTVPVKSFFAFSTTHLSLLGDLGRPDVLTGVAQGDAVTDPAVRKRFKAGEIVEFAKVGLVIDVERVVASRPSMLMATSTSNPTLAVIRHAGIPVVANSEWLEPTALGRAEWLKYMALFLNEERKAQTVFGDVKARYQALRQRVAAIAERDRPLVMTGRSTRGMFTIAGGHSYVSSLIADAGGRYAWADNPSAGIASVDFEAQVQRAAAADVWINGGGWKNLASMLTDEPRYAVFKAYQRRQVWVYERRETPTGANDFWSRSVSHPDILLADLIKILHPHLAADHEFEWYMPVPAQP